MSPLSIEQRYANILRGSTDNSPLTTPAYKLSMAQAGYPMRWEHFYLHFRRGGAQYIPFDFKAVLEALRPRLPNIREQGFLEAHGYGFTPAMVAALEGDMSFTVQPKGSWVNEQEPVALMGGPSFFISWYEDLAIAFNFPMQIATALIEGERKFLASCQGEADVIRLVWEAVKNICHSEDPLDLVGYPKVAVTVKEQSFRYSICDQIVKLGNALDGEIHRAFEVGTRSMTCMAQHRIVLEECKRAGIHRTANVQLAYDIGMIPVGTTGHEHQERFGHDINGFRAVRDRRPEQPSYLFDTYDPMQSGIPDAVQAMLEDRKRACSVRFDSGNQEDQLRDFTRAQEQHGLDISYLFMDGYDNVRVMSMENFADKLGVPREKRHYGMGGYFVSKPALTPYTRDRLAMVFKLCQTGGPGYDGNMGTRNVKKYSGSPGKESLAGRPIVVVAPDGTRYIAQQGEGLTFPGGGCPRNERGGPKPTKPSILSPKTEAISEACRMRDLGWLDF